MLTHSPARARGAKHLRHPSQDREVRGGGRRPRKGVKGRVGIGCCWMRVHRRGSREGGTRPTAGRGILVVEAMGVSGGRNKSYPWLALDVDVLAGSVLRRDGIESFDYTTQSAVVSCSLDVRWACRGYLVPDSLCSPMSRTWSDTRPPEGNHSRGRVGDFGGAPKRPPGHRDGWTKIYSRDGKRSIVYFMLSIATNGFGWS